MKFVKICGDESSANHETVDKFIDEFTKVFTNENPTPGQVYSAREHHCFGVTASERK